MMTSILTRERILEMLQGHKIWILAGANDEGMALCQLALRGLAAEGLENALDCIANYHLYMNDMIGGRAKEVAHEALLKFRDETVTK